ESTSPSRFTSSPHLLQLPPPLRSTLFPYTTLFRSEQMIGVQGEPSRNELTLSPFGKATLLTLVITYPSQEVRDTVLGTGMTEGRSEEHTSELQSRFDLVCRLLLEKKKRPEKSVVEH